MPIPFKFLDTATDLPSARWLAECLQLRRQYRDVASARCEHSRTTQHSQFDILRIINYSRSGRYDRPCVLERIVPDFSRLCDKTNTLSDCTDERNDRFLKATNVGDRAVMWLTPDP